MCIRDSPNSLHPSPKTDHTMDRTTDYNSRHKSLPSPSRIPKTGRRSEMNKSTKGYNYRTKDRTNLYTKRCV